jgi:hypothetical protein
MPSGLMSNYSHSSAKSEAGDVAACGAEDPRPWGQARRFRVVNRSSDVEPLLKPVIRDGSSLEVGIST